MDDPHRWPYASLFRRTIPNLTEPDQDGWATGDCPYCRDPGTFRVNLASGRWVLPPGLPPVSGVSAPEAGPHRVKGKRTTTTRRN